LPTKPSQTTMSVAALEDVVALDVAVEVDVAGGRRRAQQLAARLMVSLPLIASSPMLSRPTLGSSLPVDRAPPAHCPAPRTAAGARPCSRRWRPGRAPWCSRPPVGHHGGDGRAVDAVQRLQHVARQRHQRAGVAGRDAGLRRAAAASPGLQLLMATRIDESACGAAPLRPDRPSPPPRWRDQRQRGQPRAAPAPRRAPTSSSSACGWRRGNCPAGRQRDRRAVVAAHAIDRHADSAERCESGKGRVTVGR
jgi:hypothetical protein